MFLCFLCVFLLFKFCVCLFWLWFCFVVGLLLVLFFFWFCVVFLVFCFFGGFKGQVRWPKRATSLGPKPALFFVLFFLVVFFCVFVLVS